MCVYTKQVQTRKSITINQKEIMTGFRDKTEEEKERGFYCNARRRSAMTVGLLIGRYHPRGMDILTVEQRTSGLGEG